MVLDRRDLYRALTALAREQSGYFTAAQALDVGYSYQAQKYHADHGNWEKVDRGLYHLPNWPTSPHDTLVLWSLWSRGRGVVSHDTALSVRHLGDLNPAKVHLTVPKGFRPRHTGVVLHHADLPPSDVESWEGFRITTVARALVDVARAGLDADQLSDAVRDAVANGLTNAQKLRERAEAIDPAAALRLERVLTAVGT